MHWETFLGTRGKRITKVHGEAGMYYRCPCEVCVAAKRAAGRAYVAKNRLRLRAKGRERYAANIHVERAKGRQRQTFNGLPSNDKLTASTNKSGTDCIEKRNLRMSVRDIGKILNQNVERHGNGIKD